MNHAMLIYPFVVFGGETLKDVVSVLLQDRDRLVEVMVFHHRGGVDGGQGRTGRLHEGVVLAAVVQVVAQTRHEHRQALQRWWTRASDIPTSKGRKRLPVERRMT